jgi:SAM-dependent methyltransferase
MTGTGHLGALFGSADEPSAAAEEIAWYRERLPRDAGTLIELMCGYGRLLTPLVEAGYAVHGVDISVAMLAECEARLARAAVTATLFRQDIAELNVPFRYGAAFIGNGSFQRLIDVDRARAALERIRAHLVDPALLLLDLYVPAESAQRIAAPLVEVRSTPLPDGSRIALRSETTMFPDARLARTESRYVHRRGHDLLCEETQSLALTWYAPDDIVALIRDAGFRDVDVGPPARAMSDGHAYSIRATV